MSSFSTVVLIVSVLLMNIDQNFGTEDLHFSLNGQIYQTGSTVLIENIGANFTHALLCKTNNSDCCNLTDKKGDFYYPNGNAVQYSDVGVFRTRGSKVVRLNLRNSTLATPGRYVCQIPDSMGNLSNISIEIISITCPALSDVHNGMIIYSKDTTDGTTSATYNCNEGFSLDEGKRVITCDVDGSSWRGQPRTCSVHSPSMPTNVRLVKHSSTKISLSWTPPVNSYVENYNITYSYIGPCSVSSNVTMTIPGIAGNTSEHTVGGLQEFSNYSFVITAGNSAGKQSSIVVTGSTLSAAPSAKVQNLTASAVNSTTILINWKQVDCIHRNSRIVQYLVSYESSITLREQISVSKTSESFTFTGLVPRSNYTFNVSAVGEISGDNAAGTSDSVEEQTPKTTEPLLLLDQSIISNNSIIAFNEIEDPSSNGLFCITNYTNCCRRKDGSSDGRWHFPDGTNVTFRSKTMFTYMVRGPSKVVLRIVSESMNSPAGIYRCEIPIDNITRASFYIGIYAATSAGGSPIVDLEISYGCKTLTLTCTSSGGPATTVVWTRDGQVLQYNGSPFSHSQIVNNTETSTYLNILRATETSDFVGNFSCCVVNDRGTSNTVSKLLGAVNCCSPPSISNGSPGTPSNTLFGGTVTYRCNNGYNLSRSATLTVTCLSSGNWSIRPTCTAVKCGSPPSISNGSPGTPSNTSFGGTVTYRCNNGYNLSGTATVSCLASGSWDTTPECTVVDCDSPPSISDGTSGTPSSTIFGGTVTYSCNNGYIRSGSATVSCLASGSWDTTPECTVVDCGSPPSISDGTSGTPSSTIFGGTVTYSCNNGYILSRSATVTCLASGSWDTPPSCTVLSPSMPTNVRLVNHSSTKLGLSWTPPGNTSVENYKITYSYIGPCSVSPNVTMTIPGIAGDTSEHTVTGLQEFSNYSFVITAVNSEGEENSSIVTGSTLSAAPSAKVQDLTAYAVNSTTILINWKQVDCIHRNSRIVQYLVSYDASITLREQVSVKTSFTVTGLVPRSNYTFTVSAVGEINGGDNTAGTSDSVEEQTPKSTEPLLLLNQSIISNNSIITFSDIEDTSSNGLFCVTNYSNCCRTKDGSSDGRWHFPNSAGVTLQSTKLTRFTYIVRGPSKVVLHRVSRSSISHAGIYRCEIPIDNNLRASFYVGIYATSAGTPSVGVEISYDSETLTLTCTSSGGPATIVVWTRDGHELQYDGSPFSHSQVVNNTETSTYLNILRASETSDFVGNFSCHVVNYRGTSNTISKLLGGVQIIGIEGAPFTVGDAVTIQCVSDIPANEIRWLYDNQIVNQGLNISRLSLTFDPVNDSIHEVTYTCVVDRSGVLSMVPTIANTTVTVNVPMSAINTTVTSTELQPAVGNMYTLSCMININVMGLSQTPNVHWFHNGNEVSVVEYTVTVTTSTKVIGFSPLNTSDAGNYICSGNISSPAPPYSVIVNQTRNITLQIPPPTVMLTEQSQTLYANVSNQIFTCQVSLAANVDTDVQVNINWVRTLFNGDENKSADSIRLNGSLSNRMGMSMLELQDLSSKDDNVSCTAILIPLDDTFLKASDGINKTINLTVEGVYLMFNSTILNETREIHINDIVPNSSLTVSCHSDKEDCCGGAQGQWKFPNGSVVPEENNSISVTRENGLLRLTPADNVTMPGGEYCCEAQDGRGINRTVCVKLQGEITSSGTGEVVGILIFLLFLLIILVILIAVLVRLHKQGKLTLPKLNYGKVRSKQCYRVTVDPSSFDFPLDDQNDSLTPSLNVYVGVTTFSEKETGTEGQGDGEEDYFEDAQLLRIGHNSSFSVADFPGHVIRMHSDEDNLFDVEYTSISKDPQSPHNESVKSHNRSKNRFANVFPYDFNRVKLKVASDGSGSDFINASYVNGYMSNNKYIAAQGPLPHTLEDFWQMIWENRLPTIVMVTKCFEDRKKCECYWPMKEGKTLKMDNDIIVSLMSVITFADFSVRKLRVVCSLDPSSAPLEVTQFHYTAWPDHNVPSSGMSLVYFTRAVRKAHPRTEPKHLLVHCSAGVGRTGTFIVLDTMLEKMEEDGVINIYDCVTHIRKQRVLLVQTLSQYIFLHDALNELIACGETDIKAHNLRSVVDQLDVPAKNKATEGASVECRDSFTGFQKQFKVLEEFSQPDETVDYYAAQNEENEDKNRYPSIIPNEENRVRLQFTSSGSDYINASLVHGYQQRRAYIATQGPLEHTTGDFWSMVVENQCSCIVMLCTLMEGEKQSSHRYWPKFKDVTETYGDFAVTQQSIEAFGDYVVRKLEVSKQSSEATAVVSEPSLVVTQFHFTRWKAKEYPHHSASLLDLIQDVNRVQMNTNNKPIVVMCNNGIGRTGVFITLHAQLERLKIEGVIDIFQFIKSAREQREGLVSTPELYSFCHEALADYVDSFETYANFKELV